MIFEKGRINITMIPYKVRVSMKVLFPLGFALICLSCKAGITGLCEDDETPTNVTCPADEVCGRQHCKGSGLDWLQLGCAPKLGQPMECDTIVRKIGK